MGKERADELVFFVEQMENGGYLARTSDGAVFAQADGWNSLKTDVVAAVNRCLVGVPGRVRIRLVLTKVRTSSLMGYLATIYAWMLEAAVVLLHLFHQKKLNLVAHAALLLTVFLLSAFAWHRRADFRALRGSIGQMPLTGRQILAVVVFLFSLIGIIGGLAIWLIAA